MSNPIWLMLQGMYLWPIGLVISLVWGAGTEPEGARVRKIGLHIVGLSGGLAVGVALTSVFALVFMSPRLLGSPSPSGAHLKSLPYYMNMNTFGAVGAYAWLLTRESVYFKRKPHECQTCGYDLRGLPGEGTRCPECGEA